MYQLIYEPIATEEYEEAIGWYYERSATAAENFVIVVNNKLSSIAGNPYQFKKISGVFREVSTETYPYTIVYAVKEKERQVLIVAIYHHSRNPRKKYRK